MLNISILIIMFLLPVQIESYFKFEKKIELKAEKFEIDNLENIYSLNNNTLIKKDILNSKDIFYTNNFLGNPTILDISNPLRVILFYKNSNSIVFLNNQLEEISSPITLDNIHIYNPSLVCASKYGGFWIYDTSLDRIQYINKALEIEIETQNIEPLINEFTPPNYLKEIYNKIFLNIPEKGILLFNQNGIFIEKIPVLTNSIIQIENNKIYYLVTDQLGIYNLISNNNYINPLPPFKNSDIKIQNNKLYIFSGDTLSIYKINN